MIRSWEEAREKSCGVKPLTSNSDAVKVRVSVVFFLLVDYFLLHLAHRGGFAISKGL